MEHTRVEDAVFFHMVVLFNLVVDVIFYDTTTASFSIDEQDEDTDTGLGSLYLVILKMEHGVHRSKWPLP